MSLSQKLHLALISDQTQVIHASWERIIRDTDRPELSTPLTCFDLLPLDRELNQGASTPACEIAVFS